MKAKVILTIIYILVGLSLTAQEIQNFIGCYTIQEVCKSGTIPNYSDTSDYEFEIKSSSVDTFDIQFYLEAHFSDTIRAKTINDNGFQITLQTFQNIDNSLLSISGEGHVFKDSIKINYSSGGSGGEFECSCKGIKKKETGLLIEEGKTWSIVNYPTENSNIYSYYLKIGPDTTSNSVRYQKLLISYDSLKINWSLLKLIRQDQNKVYYKDIDSENEILLYDFGISESDSFQIYPGTKLIIDSIRSVGGKDHYYLSKGKATAIWIEGIGCTAGLLESHGGIGLVGLRTVLACCEINDYSLYHNENYSDCYISTSINNDKNPDFFLEQNYPNPFKYYTIINVNLRVLPSDALLNVFSIQGALVKSIKLLKPGLNEIVLTNDDLPKGVYFYNFSMGKEFSQSMKLIHY